MDITIGPSAYKGKLPRHSARNRLLHAVAQLFDSDDDGFGPDEIAVAAAFIGACWDHRYSNAQVPQPVLSVPSLADCGNRVTVYGDNVFDRLVEIGHTQVEIIKGGLRLVKVVGDSVKAAQAVVEEAGDSDPFVEPAGV